MNSVSVEKGDDDYCGEVTVSDWCVVVLTMCVRICVRLGPTTIRTSGLLTPKNRVCKRKATEKCCSGTVCAGQSVALAVRSWLPQSNV